MKPTHGRLITWRNTLAIWICVGLAAALFSVSPPGRWIEQTIAHKWNFQLRGVRAAPDGVAVISMNKRGSDLPAVIRSDRLWSRHLYASLIDRLSAAGAAVIVMDVTFEDVVDEAADSALERSLAQSNRVVMFQRLTRTEEGDVTIKPLSRFEAQARMLAVFPLPKTTRVDAYWPFFPALDTYSGEYEHRDLPSMPVAALQTQLLETIGASSFEQLLDDEALDLDKSSDTASEDLSEISSLISGLRTKIIRGQMQHDELSKLTLAQPDNDLPIISTMLHSLHMAYATHGSLMLNFYGPPRTIATLDHMAVLGNSAAQARSLEKLVSGNVVFIGHSPLFAVDQVDGMPTVYTSNGLDLSGVEIAATAYANLADGSTLRPVSIASIIAIHVLLAVLCAFLAFRTHLTKAVTYTFSLVIAYLGVCIGFFTHAYTVLPIGVPVLILIPFTLFLTLLMRHFFTNRQAAFYRQGIEQLLPPRATLAIETRGIEHAEHEPLYGTCMITDIENFTHYAEALGHKRIAMLSQEYFSLTIQRIIDSGGELFSVDGDGITAFWGSPEKSIQSGQHAIEAAKEIMSNVRRFNEQHSQTPFVTRIGLECGWVEARYLGSKGSYRYCLVGDAANTSSRLEGLNKRLGTTALASSAVAANESTLMRPVGVFLLKGKSRAIKVVEVTDRHDMSDGDTKIMFAHFAQALAMLTEGQHDAAEKTFVDFMLAYGTDGPARFYVELLNGRGDPDVYMAKHGIVRIEGK